MKKQKSQVNPFSSSVNQPTPSLPDTSNSLLQMQLKLLQQMNSQAIPSIESPSTGSTAELHTSLIPSIQTPDTGSISDSESHVPNEGTVPSTSKAPPKIYSVFTTNTSVDSNEDNVTVYFNAQDPDSDRLDWTTSLSGTVTRTESYDDTTFIGVSFSPKLEGLKPGDSVVISATVRDQDGNSDTEKLEITIKKSAVIETPKDPNPQPVVEEDNRPPIGSDHSYYRGQNKGAGKVIDPNDRGALIFGRADLDKALNDGYSMEEVYDWLKKGCWREFQKDTKDFRNMKGSGMTKLFPNTEDPSKHQILSEDELRANDGDNQAREKIPAGNWSISVIQKNASYNQRFLVHSADKGNGAYVNEGATANAVATNDWYLNIQSDKGSNFKMWQNSILKRTINEPNKIELMSEDWTDNDFDDFVLRLERNPHSS